MNIKTSGRFGIVTLEMSPDFERWMRDVGDFDRKQLEEIRAHLHCFAGCVATIYAVPPPLRDSLKKNLMASQAALAKQIAEVVSAMERATLLLRVEASPRG